MQYFHMGQNISGSSSTRAAIHMQTVDKSLVYFYLGLEQKLDLKMIQRGSGHHRHYS